MEGFDDSVDVSNEEGGIVEEVEHAASPFEDDQQEASESYGLDGDESNNNMHSTENDNAGGEKYDLGADTEGIFSSSNNDPVLPDPSQMQEESSAFREWRRYVHEL